jgi:hypothetical protein
LLPPLACGHDAGHEFFTVGHSPDPDDAFMFYAMAENKIDLRGYRFEHRLEDIQTLNELALRAVAHPRNWRIHSRIRTNQRRVQKQDDLEIPIFTVNEKRAFGDNAEVEIRFTKDRASDKDEARLPNFFFDFTRSISWDTAKIENCETPTNANFISGKALWKTVKDRQWRRCNEINGQRLAQLGK